MEAIGLISVTSVSAAAVKFSTSDSSLTSESNQFLQSAPGLKSAFKSRIRGLRWKHLATSVVTAVLIEPTKLQKLQLDYGRQFEDLHSEASPELSSTTVPPGSSGAPSASSSSTTASTTERLRREMVPLHHLRQGGMADTDPLVYKQIFVTRSYEVGPDRSTSIREVFSWFQEVALNHVQLLGIAGAGFGATRAMNRRGLIWVVTRMQVAVERYPAWPEAVEIESWVSAAGRNGMRRDWVMRSYQTGQVLARATSTWCMMNGTTRRLSKTPDDVRAEIEPHFTPACRCAFADNECSATRIPKLDDASAEHHSSQLVSSLADLDMNQHVNNLKYINWVLESVPVEHMKTHTLASMVMEYRRECHSTDVVESLTSSKTNVDAPSLADCSDSVQEIDSNGVEAGWSCQYTHLLRTQDAGQQEILRGETTWRSRRADN